MFVVGKMNFCFEKERRIDLFFFLFLFRRDADEQLVLAHVWNKLSNVAQILTIHVFKDDWLRHQTHTFMQSQNMHQHHHPPSSSSSNLLSSSTHNGFVVVT